MKSLKHIVTLGSMVLAASALVACGGGSGNGSVERSYDVTLTNITQNQPLAPAAVIFHKGDFSGWQIGSAASEGLERLAESGDPAMFLAEADAGDAFAAEAASEMPVGPGGQANVIVEFVTLPQDDVIELSIATMPVNTNDAFTGVAGLDVADLDIGETTTFFTPLYDAGTEFNSETADTIPGPAAGGEGFNAARDDIANLVARHPGVVTQGNGYADSALNESHRMDNPIMQVTVTRLQ